MFELSTLNKLRNFLATYLDPSLCEYILEKLLIEHESKTLIAFSNDTPMYVNVGEILYLTRLKGNLVKIHTMDSVYSYEDKKFDLIEFLSREHGFYMVDSKLAICPLHIKKYNSRERNIYFHDSGSKEYPFVSVTERTVREFLKVQFGKEFDIHSSNDEYAPLGVKRMLRQSD
ncbi:hypothetical protein [Paenibacillus chitinolyticus]|uniref:hypothetical protein n=1 Tax=Paenibacillus chitinolyticus TaxID=79263 RepID=UPI003671A331